LRAVLPDFRPCCAHEVRGQRHTGEDKMFMKTKRGRAFGQGLVIAGLVAASAAFVSTASAGECPADKVKAGVREMVTTPSSGVTDNVLAALDLANEAPKLKGSQMRVRKLVIQPGGVVAWHSHADRPALIYIVEGEIIEYASNCSAPIVHKAGEVSREHHGIAHWWKNTGEKTVTLLSFDIRRDPNDKHM
jgi:quercetin dioxygenase-like cupin family protein